MINSLTWVSSSANSKLHQSDQTPHEHDISHWHFFGCSSQTRLWSDQTGTTPSPAASVLRGVEWAIGTRQRSLRNLLNHWIRKTLLLTSTGNEDNNAMTDDSVTSLQTTNTQAKIDSRHKNNPQSSQRGLSTEERIPDTHRNIPIHTYTFFIPLNLLNSFDVFGASVYWGYRFNNALKCDISNKIMHTWGPGKG